MTHDGSIDAEEDTDARATSLADSFKLHPFDVAVAREYADYLRCNKRYREALSVIFGLPGELRRDPSIRTVLGDVYRSIDLHAHAVSAYGNPHDLPRKARKSRRESWLVAPDSVGLYPWSPRKHVEARESKIKETWDKWCTERIATFDTLDLPQRPDLTQVRIELETELFSRARLHVRRDIEARWARRVYVLPLFSACAWLLLIATTRLSGIIAGFAVYLAMIVSFLARRVIDHDSIAARSIPRERRVEYSRQIFILAIVTGLFSLAVAPAETWWAFTGGVLAAAAFISLAWLYPAYRCDWLISGLRHEQPRQVILDDLLRLLSEISDSGKRNSLETRASWIAQLEDVASMIERNLLGNLRGHDLAIREWVAEWASDVAGSLHSMEAQLAAPVAQSWERLTSGLRRTASVIALGEFGALEGATSSPSETIRRRRSRTPIFTFDATLVIVSFVAVPIAVTYAAWVLHANPDIIAGVLIAAFTFATTVIGVHTRRKQA